MRSTLAAFILTLVVLGSACKKEQPTICVITVKNLKLAPVAGADVHLHAKDIPEPAKPGEYQHKGKTDSQGKVSFEIPLEAIYTVEAKKDSLYGRSRVRLIKGETVELSITLE